MPTTLKLSGCTLWIHTSRVKKWTLGKQTTTDSHRCTVHGPHSNTVYCDYSETATQKWGDGLQWRLKSLLQLDSSSKNCSEETMYPKPCPHQPGSWWVNTWLKIEQTPYTRLSVTLTYCYPIKLLVLFLPAVLVFAVVLWAASPQWRILEKVVFVFFYLAVANGLSTIKCLKWLSYG